MKFPDMTTTTINVPKCLLEEIDTYAEQHVLNRSACIRLLTAKGLKDATARPEDQGIAFCYAESKEPLS